jgi:hypothetical protein
MKRDLVKKERERGASELNLTSGGYQNSISYFSEADMKLIYVYNYHLLTWWYHLTRKIYRAGVENLINPTNVGRSSLLFSPLLTLKKTCERINRFVVIINHFQRRLVKMFISTLA